MIIAKIASLANRELLLRNTVQSLINQVDKIEIGLNKYYSIPDFCKHEKIECWLLDNRTGDAAKFYNIENYKDSYILSCDDDIIYPANYVQEMCYWVDCYETLVSLHGRSFDIMPISSYYKSATLKLRCLGEVKTNQSVMIAGSGVAAWHTRFLELKYNEFLIPNMADIYLSYFAKRQGLTPMVIKHSANYLIYQTPPDTIYMNAVKDDRIQTDFVNFYF